jgi:hypothetical protein
VSTQAARCSELSELAGESLAATASTTQSWLLVEVPGTWPRDVSDGDGLPEAARRAVHAWLERTPSSRLLFIRRPGRWREGRTLVFVAHAAPTRTRVHRLELVRLDDLDLEEPGGHETGSQLVLVCGHGTRDPCCALRGTAVYGALASSLGPEQVWISSHQGGHRFAANVLVLPSAVQLGRISSSEAPAVVLAALAGRIELDHFRGRAMYAPEVQAADIAVRRAFGLDRIADLDLVEVEGGMVRFRDVAGREHVALVEQRSGPVVPASCGAAPEPQVGFSARLV